LPLETVETRESDDDATAIEAAADDIDASADIAIGYAIDNAEANSVLITLFLVNRIMIVTHSH
jgi:hypothetical protein